MRRSELRSVQIVPTNRPKQYCRTAGLPKRNTSAADIKCTRAGVYAFRFGFKLLLPNGNAEAGPACNPHAYTARNTYAKANTHICGLLALRGRRLYLLRWKR